MRQNPLRRITIALGAALLACASLLGSPAFAASRHRRSHSARHRAAARRIHRRHGHTRPAEGHHLRASSSGTATATAGGATQRPAAAGGVSECPFAEAAVSTTAPAEIKTAVVCLIDQQRIARGLPALSASADLGRSAQGWSQSMVATGQFTHGIDFAARITQAGLHWSAAGENIATGYSTPAGVVAAWMASQGHCENILNPTFSQVGIGVVSEPVARYATQPATWTADFALPLGAQPASRDTGPMLGCPYRS